MNVANLCIYSNPKLIKLSIDNLIKLKDVSIRDNIELKELTSSSNSITELDILGVPKLKTLLMLPLLLTKLEISSEKITELQIEKLINLKYLQIQNNLKLTKLLIDGLIKLKTLNKNPFLIEFMNRKFRNIKYK